ncbi:MAG: Na/Pi cotransporter family protein [Actinobacteria bacterium]|nr:Na/Pi cotransporter family protein [Actinomycetota bacterium]MCG2818225.1 Na/Pi cotransporter family protein [Actinomycetes bacterium]MBU4178850.1 Na/Pi cotransporter family protein [Actinomycetota bacterium]MBU4219622.1 Na/Pi cotransporter family protein [Actinomycetota bacterium]MBU4358463.1 Na/Pi cotransporter family protein [Actinomycetota bacterium]
MWIAIRLLGGLAIFMFGMSLMSEGFQNIAGGRLQRTLEALTRNRWVGAAVGTGVTAVIQSSSVTTVMLVGFVNAGLMTFAASVAVIFGANIGTTITAQIVAFDIGNWALLLVAVGFPFYFFSTSRKFKFTGEGILGLGLLFLGMVLMKDAVHPLGEMAWFLSLIDFATHNPFLGVLFGAVLTAIVQSSSATTGMIIAMAMSGVIPGGTEGLRVAIPFILGANVGTCVTAMLAAVGTNRQAKRTAVAHVLFNVAGAIVFLPLLPLFYRFISSAFGGVSLARQIAISHTVFNVTMALIMLPLIKPFVRLVKYIVRGEDPLEHRNPLAVEPHVLHSPWAALAQAGQEVSYMGHLAGEMVSDSIGLVRKMNRSTRQNLVQKEKIVDNLAEATTEYLSKLSRETLDDEQAERLTALMHAVNDIERVGDHAENIMYLASARNEGRYDFSYDAWAELDEMSDRVQEMFSGVIEAFGENDPEKAEHYQYFEHGVDEMKREFRKNHIARLNAGTCAAPAGAIFLDIVSNLERIGDLANNVGYVTRGELGSL